MKRRDFEFLADQCKTMLEAGTMERGGFYWLCSQLDTNYGNFNRELFEEKVLGKWPLTRLKRRYLANDF